MKPRQEIEILQNLLFLLKDRPRMTREIVVSTYLNNYTWMRYHTRMLELGLIDEAELKPGKAVYYITPGGEELLKIIGVYRSMWPSFPPKPKLVKKQFKPWQKAVFKHIYENGEAGFTVTEAWICTQSVDRVSRTRVSMFINRMAEKGILENSPRRGRGGMHGFYTLKTTNHDFESFLKDMYPKMINYYRKRIRSVDR